jgi:molybdopterin-guanine dinucleotide biosynthesis protein A
MTLVDDKSALPPIYGLILAGGRSSRMGHDKGAIKWFGKEHRFYLADMISSFCSSVYISCREDQLEEIQHSHYKGIADVYPGAGPMGGILSAFKAYPEVAWLVVACDMPLLNNEAINFLIQERDPRYIATTFRSPHDQLPEPLFTIWEPAAQQVLLNSLNNNSKCPRRVLNEQSAKIISATYPEGLLNANTPEEAENAKRIILN